MELESMPPAAPPHYERRRHPRFYVDLPVTYYEMDSSVRYDSFIKHNGRAINASEEGLMIYFRKDIEMGQDLKMKLSFPIESKLESIQVQTKVVWIDITDDMGWGNYRHGVNFINISVEDKSKFKSFLMESFRIN